MGDEKNVAFPKEFLEAVDHIPTRERALEMLNRDIDYANCFFNRDFDGMLEHLVDNPEYEMQPLGLRLTGTETIRERSKRLQRNVIGQIDNLLEKDRDSVDIRSVAFGKDTLIVEWSNDFTMPDGSVKRSYAIAVIPYEGDKMVGERVYTCQNLAEVRKHALGDDILSVPGVEKI